MESEKLIFQNKSKHLLPQNPDDYYKIINIDLLKRAELQVLVWEPGYKVTLITFEKNSSFLQFFS